MWFRRAVFHRFSARAGAAFLIKAAVVLIVLTTCAAAELSGEQEARYRALLEELRCLVCQNQTLAESNAELAGDLRGRVLTMVEDGESDEAILSFMTERYGDFIRYRPPVNPRTYLLWAMPLLLLAGLLTALFRFVAAQSRKREPPA